MPCARSSTGETASEVAHSTAQSSQHNYKEEGRGSTAAARISGAHGIVDTQRKRIACSTVLDLVIDNCNDEVDSHFVQLESMQPLTEFREDCAPSHHSSLGRSDAGELNDNQRGTQSNLGPSRASVRLEVLRERVLGRIAGKMRRLESE